MRARAPGKLVLSGAYAVLDGAPAIVTAVDRYAIADTSRPASHVTPEVAEALARRGSTTAPWFDAAELRDAADNRKLGLGSSAAILVASLAALELEAGADPSDAALAARVFPVALAAHRAAQGGGSGVDVAASTFGGILRFERGAGDEAPRIEPFALPESLFIGVFSSSRSASTPDMLARVSAFAGAHPRDHRRIMDHLGTAATAAASATRATSFVDACREQLALFTELGDLAGVPIVTSEMRSFGRDAPAGVVLPSGAGGGDVTLYVGTEPPYEAVDRAGRRLGFLPLAVSLGARGLHAASPSSHQLERNDASP